MRELEAALERVDRVHLASLPTPLERMERMEKLLGYSGLYIKRDDLTGLGPGGNKLRSLEYIAGKAVKEGKDTLIASGPLQSNLCTLTAAACAKLGLGCILVHNGDEPERLEGNLILNRLLGAKAYYLGNVDAEERAGFAEGLEEKLSGQCSPFVIQNGATTGRGAMGYVNAVLELRQQFQGLGLERGTLFVPGGNGGVASGLIYGNARLGFPFQVVVISVEDEKSILYSHIEKTIGEIEEILGLPLGCCLDKACVVEDQYRGGGWGENTEESARMVRDFPRMEGILIENVYNSKVLVGMENYIRRGLVEGPACYLHTGGFGSLFAQEGGK